MVNITAPMTIESNTTGSTSLPIGDNLVDRIYVDLPHSETVDLTTATTESGETTNSMTKTVWREFSVADRTKIRVQATGTGARVGLWRQNQASLDTDAEPLTSNLERVGASSLSDITVAVDPTWPPHFAQIGVTSGTGSSTTILIEDATPPDGGTFASAFLGYGTYGTVILNTLYAVTETGEPIPAGITPTGTAWLLWTAPTPAPARVKFEVPSVGTVGTISVAAYTGSAVNALSMVTSAAAPAANGVSIEFTPTAGVVYALQVGTTEHRNQYDLVWSQPAESAPSLPPVESFDYLRVAVYDKDGVTLITDVPNRTGVSGQEALNIPGTGSISVPLNDGIMTAYTNLLRPGRFVKFFLGSTCISAFRIQQRSTVWVSGGEYAGMVQSVSGPTVQYLLSDMIVHHDEDPRPDSPSTRFYSWASRPGETGAADDWYKPSDWNASINANTQQDPPGDWKKPAAKRAKYGMPKNWPDDKSLWVWISNDPTKNEGGWANPRPIAGRRYYRKNFNITEDGTKVRLFVTADETAVVYLDGDEVIRRENRENGYRTFSKYNTTLSAGKHTVAILVRDGGKRTGDGNDSMMFSMYNVNKDGTRGDVLIRSNRTWQAYYGRGVPGWNRAQVLKNSILEGRERANDSANLLVLGFDGLNATDGQPWTDKFNQEVQIGTTGLDLQSQLSESGRFDVWVDPANMTIKAWRKRGANKSASVALMPGVNLLDYAAEEVDEVGNHFLIQFDGGFTKVEVASSKKTYGSRETFISLGGTKDADTARDAVRGAVAAFRGFRKRSGSPEVILRVRKDRSGSLIGLTGAYPFLDFNVGDVISAPDEQGRLVPQRVMALSFTENEEGQLTFDPELEQIAPPQSIGASV